MSNFKNLTVYVSNFDSKKMSEDLLKELFDQIEPVQSVSLKGEYAFVNFKDEESVSHVCREMDGIKIFDIPLNVKPKAKSKIERYDETRKRQRSLSRESLPRQKRHKRELSLEKREYERRPEHRRVYSRSKIRVFSPAVERRVYSPDRREYTPERRSYKLQRRVLDPERIVHSSERRVYRPERRGYSPERSYEYDGYSDDIAHHEYKPERIYKNKERYDEMDTRRYEIRDKDERKHVNYDRGIPREYTPEKRYKRHGVNDINYILEDKLKMRDRSEYSMRNDERYYKKRSITDIELNLKDKLYKALKQYDEMKQHYSDKPLSKVRYGKDMDYDRYYEDKYSSKISTRKYESLGVKEDNKNMYYLKPKFGDGKLRKTIYNDIRSNINDNYYIRDLKENKKYSIEDNQEKKVNKFSKNNIKQDDEIIPKKQKSKCIKVENDLEEGEMTS